MDDAGSHLPVVEGMLAQTCDDVIGGFVCLLIDPFTEVFAVGFIEQLACSVGICLPLCLEELGADVKEDGVDEVLLFVVDILNEEATMLIPNDLTKAVAEASFDATVSGDTVVLPGIMSRKKQIIPNLKL